MSNLQEIENRIVSIAKLKGLSKNKLLINANLNKSIFDNMKKGQNPSFDKIETIADYLDCSVDYILGRCENPNAHKIGIQNDSKQLTEIISIYNRLNTIGQARLLAFAADLDNDNKVKTTQDD